MEVTNPFDLFIDMCYQQKFEKYMPCALNSAGFHTKIIVLIIGSLGVVHRKFLSGLYIWGFADLLNMSSALKLFCCVLLAAS